MICVATHSPTHPTLFRKDRSNQLELLRAKEPCFFDEQFYPVNCRKTLLLSSFVLHTHKHIQQTGILSKYSLDKQRVRVNSLFRCFVHNFTKHCTRAPNVVVRRVLWGGRPTSGRWTDAGCDWASWSRDVGPMALKRRLVVAVVAAVVAALWRCSRFFSLLQTGFSYECVDCKGKDNAAITLAEIIFA